MSCVTLENTPSIELSMFNYYQNSVLNSKNE